MYLTGHAAHHTTMPSCTHSHSHAHTHTTHTCSTACHHATMPSCTHIHSHSHTHARTHTHGHTDTYTQMQGQTHIRRETRIQRTNKTRAHTYMRPQPFCLQLALIHCTKKHRYTHTNTHTHTYTHAAVAVPPAASLNPLCLHNSAHACAQLLLALGLPLVALLPLLRRHSSSQHLLSMSLVGVGVVVVGVHARVWGRVEVEAEGGSCGEAWAMGVGMCGVWVWIGLGCVGL